MEGSEVIANLNEPAFDFSINNLDESLVKGDYVGPIILPITGTLTPNQPNKVVEISNDIKIIL